jgi:hypothetical protein
VKKRPAWRRSVDATVAAAHALAILEGALHRRTAKGRGSHTRVATPDTPDPKPDRFRVLVFRSAQFFLAIVMRGHHRRHHCGDDTARDNAHGHTGRGREPRGRAAAAASDPRSWPAHRNPPTRRSHQPEPTCVADNHQAHANADPHTPARAGSGQPQRSRFESTALPACHATIGGGCERVRPLPF